MDQTLLPQPACGKVVPSPLAQIPVGLIEVQIRNIRLSPSIPAEKVCNLVVEDGHLPHLDIHCHQFLHKPHDLFVGCLSQVLLELFASGDNHQYYDAQGMPSVIALPLPHRTAHHRAR